MRVCAAGAEPGRDPAACPFDELGCLVGVRAIKDEVGLVPVAVSATEPAPDVVEVGEIDANAGLVAGERLEAWSAFGVLV